MTIPMIIEKWTKKAKDYPEDSPERALILLFLQDLSERSIHD
jgi:hypothetical protein